MLSFPRDQDVPFGDLFRVYILPAIDSTTSLNKWIKTYNQYPPTPVFLSKYTVSQNPLPQVSTYIAVCLSRIEDSSSELTLDSKQRSVLEPEHISWDSVCLANPPVEACYRTVLQSSLALVCC